MPARRVMAVLGGLVLALAVFLAVRALHASLVPGEPFDVDWINGFALAVVAAALVLCWVEQADAARALRPARPAASCLATAIAALSVLAYEGLGNVQFPYHRWEQFTYYIGAKYFPELGYTRLYACTAVAEAERVGPRWVASRPIRDLLTDELVPGSTALEHPEACKGHFSPARWAAFVEDVNWFRTDTVRPYWIRMQGDHGFNPPPPWVVSGRALASLAPASARTQTRLALIDPVLLVAAFALVGWAFGAHVFWVALVVWGCQFPAKGAWTAGAFLRQDWFLAFVASVCLARRGRWLGAGAALATSAALRIFPALLLAVPLLVAARRWWQTGSLAHASRRFAAGLLLGGAFWFATSTALFGPGAWREFAEHMARHRAAPLANHVGLRAILSQTIDGRLAVTQDDRQVDPYREWKARRKAAFTARRPLYVAAVCAIVLVSLAASLRIRRLWCALVASSALVMALLDLASYYYAFFVGLALLAARSASLERLALGAVAVDRLINVPALVTGNPDVQYALHSIVFLTWAVLAVVIVTWGRGARPARMPSP